MRSLRVIEFLQPVIDWHRSGLVPMGEELTSDSRCQLVQDDFFRLARDPAGFDGGRKFHAALLDIDHTPRDFLYSRNAAFYTTAGLKSLSAHLHPGGVFSMWSDDPPDAEFLAILRSAFATARAEVVTFPNPILERNSASTVYLARKASD